MKITKKIENDGLPTERITWKNENGEYHREDGPAVAYKDGTKYWILNGKIHREDGPARIWNDDIKGWYLNGINYTEEEYNQEMYKRNLHKLNEST